MWIIKRYQQFSDTCSFTGTHLYCRQTQQLPPNHWYVFNRLHCIMSEQIVIIIFGIIKNIRSHIEVVRCWTLGPINQTTWCLNVKTTVWTLTAVSTKNLISPAHFQVLRATYSFYQVLHKVYNEWGRRISNWFNVQLSPKWELIKLTVSNGQSGGTFFVVECNFWVIPTSKESVRYIVAIMY